MFCALKPCQWFIRCQRWFQTPSKVHLKESQTLPAQVQQRKTVCFPLPGSNKNWDNISKVWHIVLIVTSVVGQIPWKADSESVIYLLEGSWEQHTRGSEESRSWRERLNYDNIQKPQPIPQETARQDGSLGLSWKWGTGEGLATIVFFF